MKWSCVWKYNNTWQNFKRSVSIEVRFIIIFPENLQFRWLMLNALHIHYSTCWHIKKECCRDQTFKFFYLYNLIHDAASGVWMCSLMMKRPLVLSCVVASEQSSLSDAGSCCRFLPDTPSENLPLPLLFPFPSGLPPQRLMSLCWYHVMGGDIWEFTCELPFPLKYGNLRLTYLVSASWQLCVQLSAGSSDF